MSSTPMAVQPNCKFVALAPRELAGCRFNAETALKNQPPCVSTRFYSHNLMQEPWANARRLIKSTACLLVGDEGPIANIQVSF